MNEMKIKTIKKTLHNKIAEWIDSVKDENLKKLLNKNTICTGGAIASMLLREKVKDFDIYFKDRATTQAVADYYVKIFLSKHPNQSITVDSRDDSRIKIFIPSSGVAGMDDLESDEQFEDVYDVLPENSKETEKPTYEPVFLSSNAITLTGKIQLVIRFYGQVGQIHENYDFVHCTNAYDYESKTLLLKEEALSSLLTKELKYQGSKYPLCSVIRTRKFISRGFTVNAGEYLKMLMQLNDLDLKNLDVLEDQLCGVDSAYFGVVINALNKVDSDKLTTSYIVAVIENVFD